MILSHSKPLYGPSGVATPDAPWATPDAPWTFPGTIFSLGPTDSQGQEGLR